MASNTRSRSQSRKRILKSNEVEHSETPNNSDIEDKSGYITPIVISREDRAKEAAGIIEDLLKQLIENGSIIFINENFNPLWEPSCLSTLWIGGAIPSLIVSYLKLVEDFADEDLSGFFEHVQSFELDARIIDLMKKLNDALSTRTNSRASKRSRNSDISSSSSKGSQQT